MKTNNTHLSGDSNPGNVSRKWIRAAALAATFVLTAFSMITPASARVIFENDAFYKIQSEGININEDDGGDEDVTLKFGNDGTDATMTFDDGTGNVTFATSGGTFSFSDDSITTTGGASISGATINLNASSNNTTNIGTGSTTSAVNIGGGSNNVVINSDTWDVSSAGAMTGVTGITSTGNINFSGSSQLLLRTAGSEPGTCTEGEIYYNTATDVTSICTSTNSWTALSSGGTPTWDAIYTEDQALDTSNGDLTFTSGSGDFIIDSANWNVDASGNADFTGTLTANGTFDANGTVTIGDDGDNVTIDSSVWDISSAGAASGFTTFALSGDITMYDAVNDGNPQVRIGATDAEEAHIQSVYDTGAQTLDYVLFQTDVASGTADQGMFRFNVDGTNVLDIDDGGINFSANMGISINGTDILTDSSGTATLSNIDAVDATTENTVEALIFDADAESITGVWTVADNTALQFGTGGDVLIQYDETTDDRLEITGTNADVYIEDSLTVATNATVTGTITAGSGTVQITNAAGNLDGEQIADNTIDEDSIDWGTGAGQISAADIVIADGSSWYTGTETETALDELEALLGSTTSTTYGFGEDNVLADNDAVYAALNKLDLKWGDLASTADAEGAALIGIEDDGSYTTQTNVEEALQEIYGMVGSNADNVELLEFYPEYPDSVVYADGGTNKGTLESLYDSTEGSNYYNWTTTQAANQDVDIMFSFPLPADFTSLTNAVLALRTNTTSTDDNGVTLTVSEIESSETVTSCGASSATASGTNDTWTTVTVSSFSGCTLTAGDTILVQIHLDAEVDDYADVGRLEFTYAN